MAYREFSYPDVIPTLGLKAAAAPLFSDLPPAPTDPRLLDALDDGRRVAVGSNSEKARSECLISPLLQEARRLLGRRHAVFSGVTFDVDPARKLNGVFDFLISRDPNTFLLTAPLVAVAEGKNGIAREGYAQCIAGMVAVRDFNAAAGSPLPRVYGIATNGTEWKFMRLAGDALTIDADDYYIDSPGRLLGVLCHIIEHG